MKLILPWFNKFLNPNNKVHWAVKAKLRAKQRSDAYWIALEAPKPPKADKYNLEIIFYPPDERHRDIDNCLSACKGFLDGVAMAWKVNDKQFRFKDLDFGNVIKNGAIVIICENDDV